MSFFDDKQEIIKLELTTYGRYLLSKGKLKPVYYAFFDDDIIYDSEFMGLSESQNSTQVRILEETPSLKPQTTFSGIENTIFKNKNLVLNEIEEFKQEELQNDSDRNYALSLPIGTTSPYTDYAPAWSVNFLNGSISSSYEYIDNADGNSGSLQPYMKIPQLHLNDTYIKYIINKNSRESEKNYNLVANKQVNNDTYSIFLNNQDLLVDFNELNTLDFKENFDIEIFIEKKSIINNEVKTDWKQLKFNKKNIQIKNNILLDAPITYKPEENTNSVEYYFNFTVDEEIDLSPSQLLSIGQNPIQTAAQQQDITTIEQIRGSIYQAQVQPDDGPFGEDC